MASSRLPGESNIRAREPKPSGAWFRGAGVAIA